MTENNTGDLAADAFAEAVKIVRTELIRLSLVKVVRDICITAGAVVTIRHFAKKRSNIR